MDTLIERQTIKLLRDEVPNLGVTGGLKNETDEMKQRVNDHITLYLKMWDPSSGYSIKVNILDKNQIRAIIIFGNFVVQSFSERTFSI